jgi:hypothetical protein
MSLCTASLIDQLFALLTDQANASLSNRELARRCNVNHDFVAGFRAALKRLPAPEALSAAGTVAATPAAALAAKALPSSGTRSTTGHTVPFEAPVLNSLDCWALATDEDRRRFVDAVGLRHLYDAAPEDHRRAFNRSPDVASATSCSSPR